MQAIGVLTSGGDSPGMNPHIRAVVRAGVAAGLTVYGIERGYHGLINGCLAPLDARDVSGLIDRGGTFLRTARCAEFMEPAGRAQAAAVLREKGIEGLVVCGGDGSFRGALALHQEHGIRIAATPGTIDNDLAGTDHTIGFDTAVQSALDACDKIRDTANSHDRIFVVEVMGRHAGFIALATAVAAGAEVVLVPEAPVRGLEHCVGRLKVMQERGKTSMLVVVAEGAASGLEVGKAIEAGLAGTKVRVSVLGHILRGGSPSHDDRILATRTGAEAVEALREGCDCVHVGVIANRLVRTPVAEIIKQRKPLDPSLLELIDTMSV